VDKFHLQRPVDDVRTEIVGVGGVYVPDLTPGMKRKMRT